MSPKEPTIVFPPFAKWVRWVGQFQIYSREDEGRGKRCEEDPYPFPMHLLHHPICNRSFPVGIGWAPRFRIIPSAPSSFLPADGNWKSLEWPPFPLGDGGERGKLIAIAFSESAVYKVAAGSLAESKYMVR